MVPSASFNHDLVTTNILFNFNSLNIGVHSVHYRVTSAQMADSNTEPLVDLILNKDFY